MVAVDRVGATVQIDADFRAAQAVGRKWLWSHTWLLKAIVSEGVAKDQADSYSYLW